MRFRESPAGAAKHRNGRTWWAGRFVRIKPAWNALAPAAGNGVVPGVHQRPHGGRGSPEAGFLSATKATVRVSVVQQSAWSASGNGNVAGR